MKTLREYIDQLDEISRRDFLKGAGATAVGAVGGIAGDRYLNQQKRLPNNPQVYYLIGFLAAAVGTHPFRRFNNDLLTIEKKIDPLWDEVRVEVDSQPDPTLKNAYNKGWDQGRASLDALNPENIKFYYNSDVSKKTEADMQARRMKPYYEKLQDLLKSTNEDLEEEATPDAVNRIEQLVQYK